MRTIKESVSLVLSQSQSIKVALAINFLPAEVSWKTIQITATVLLQNCAYLRFKSKLVTFHCQLILACNNHSPHNQIYGYCSDSSGRLWAYLENNYFATNCSILKRARETVIFGFAFAGLDFWKYFFFVLILLSSSWTTCKWVKV